MRCILLLQSYTKQAKLLPEQKSHQLLTWKSSLLASLFLFKTSRILLKYTFPFLFLFFSFPPKAEGS